MDTTAPELNVRLEIFEGPLDLLLYLIRRDEVDIHDIPIARITGQYMEILQSMKDLNLDVAGEFIVMASTLILIKSRMLLPREERPEEEEEEDDPRLDLVRQLVEYRKFKDASHHLETLEEDQLNVFPRGAIHIEVKKETGSRLNDVSIFDLITAFNDALRRLEDEKRHEITGETFTVAQKVEDIMIRLRREPRVTLHTLFAGMTSREEIVCTFLATLELIKLAQIEVSQQEDAFDDIVITPVDGAVALSHELISGISFDGEPTPPTQAAEATEEPPATPEEDTPTP